MALKNSDAQILQYILKYCFEVETTSKLFRVSANKIKENFGYPKLVVERHD